MVKALTKRNHYNPCFWTACWNIDYFQALMRGKSDSIIPRDQEVFVLNLISGNIYLNKVKNVHLEKDLGVAEITPESMKDFCRRYLNTSDYESFCKSLEENPEPLFINFEDILTAIEGFKSYQSLMDAVKACGIQNIMHK